MDDYSSDMADLSSRSAAIILELKRKNERLRHILHAAVHTIGRIKIPPHLHEPGCLGIVIEREHDTECLVLYPEKPHG